MDIQICQCWRYKKIKTSKVSTSSASNLHLLTDARLWSTLAIAAWMSGFQNRQSSHWLLVRSLGFRNTDVRKAKMCVASKDLTWNAFWSPLVGSISANLDLWKWPIEFPTPNAVRFYSPSFAIRKHQPVCKSLLAVGLVVKTVSTD